MMIRHISWIPPSDLSSWKLNFAGCISHDGSGYGCILRDQNAVFKAACAAPLTDCRDLLMAELTALYQGLLLALKQGVDYIEIEGDQSVVIQMLAGQQPPPFSPISHSILQECFDCIKSFRTVKVRLINELSNEAANIMARIVTKLQEPSYWDGHPPTEIAATLVTDVIGRWIS